MHLAVLLVLVFLIGFSLGELRGRKIEATQLKQFVRDELKLVESVEHTAVSLPVADAAKFVASLKSKKMLLANLIAHMRVKL